MKKSLVKHNLGKITGELNVLKSPVFIEAFNTLLDIYTPKHDIAVFALCTQTKPFSKSMKWRGIIKIFGEIADLIICSSAGIIPLEYEDYYPFNNYDSHSGHEGSAWLSDYSKYLFKKRCEIFLTKFKWNKVVFLLDPYEGAADVIHHLGMKNVKQFPSPNVWNNTSEQDFIGYSLRFCKVLSRGCMKEVEQFIEIPITYLQKHSFNRNMSLFQLMREIYEHLEENKAYTRKELFDIINSYNNGYDRSYVYKIIEGNVMGVKDYKYYIKNNHYFIKLGKYYYKNTGKPIKMPKKLF